MLGEATAAGARVEYKRRLVSINGTAAAPVLHFAASDDVAGSRPPQPAAAAAPPAALGVARTCAAAGPPALMAPSPTEGAKLYMYYDAWWRNTLGLTSGEFHLRAKTARRR